MPDSSSSNSSEPLPTGPVVLLLLDGWGIAPAGESNIISLAKTPAFANLVKEYPVAALQTGNRSLNARYLTIGAGKEIADETEKADSTLSSVVAAAGLKQKKIVETERLAALTYFFNGRREDRFAGESWQTVSSLAANKSVKPLLALKRTARELVKTLESEDRPAFIAAALPLLDIVAPTGDLKTIRLAAEALDDVLEEIMIALETQEGTMIVTAAGGNAERMFMPGTDLLDASLTANPVPFLICGRRFQGRTIGLEDPMNSDLSLLAPAGTLADIAPTILSLLGLTPPPEMTGADLLAD